MGAQSLVTSLGPTFGLHAAVRLLATGQPRSVKQACVRGADFVRQRVLNATVVHGRAATDGDTLNDAALGHVIG